MIKLVSSFYCLQLWVGMTMASARNRNFLRRIVGDFLQPPTSRGPKEKDRRGRLVVVESADLEFASKCVQTVASVLEDKMHLRVSTAQWSKDRVAKFAEKVPGARRPRSFTDKYTRKDNPKGDIFIIQGDLTSADLADRDTMGFADQIVSEIRPALEAGTLVVVSHYWYQVVMRYRVRGLLSEPQEYDSHFFQARGGQHTDLVSSRFGFCPEPDLAIFIDVTPEAIVRRMMENQDQYEYLATALKHVRETAVGKEIDDPFADMEEHLPFNFVESGLDTTHQKHSFGVGRQGITDALRDYFRRTTAAFSDISKRALSRPNAIQVTATAPAKAADEILTAMKANRLADHAQFYQEIPAFYRKLSFALLVASLLCTIVSVLVELPRIAGSSRRIV